MTRTAAARPLTRKVDGKRSPERQRQESSRECDHPPAGDEAYGVDAAFMPLSGQIADCLAYPLQRSRDLGGAGGGHIAEAIADPG